jgi:predicted component of type VI protein secretion system
MFDVMLQRAIIDVINNFEPRVEIIDVRVNDASELNAVYITLEFKIVNTERPITLDLALERTR